MQNTPASDSSPAPDRLGAWLLRALLAALLLFAAEFLLWNDPLGRDPLDWALRLPAYLLLAALLLDVLMRYRVRDLWGAMLALGIYAIGHAVLLNPQRAFALIPDSLLTNALGAQWTVGLEAFGLWLVLLLGGRAMREKRLLLMSAFILGFTWATWVLWLPAFNPGIFRAVNLIEMFGGMLLGALPGLLLWGIIRRRPPRLPAAALRLTRQEAGLLVLLALALFIVNIARGLLSLGTGVAVALLLAGVFWVVLWFRGDTRKATLLDEALPMRPLGTFWLLLAILVFGLAALLGASRPLTDFFGVNQFNLIGFVFRAVGTGWMPLVAAIIGVEAFARQVQKLDI